MIKEIRDYFTKQIRAVDSDLKFDGYIFENESIGTNNIDNTFKLIIGQTVPTRRDVIHEALTDVSVVIFKVSGTDRVNGFDQLYCKAFNIVSKIASQSEVLQNDFIKSIINKTVLPEAINSDDNSVRIKIEFQVITFFALEA